MELFLIIVLLLAAIWDGFTTIYGTVTILGSDPLQIAISLLFSGLIIGFVLNTRKIMRWHSRVISGIAKFLWLVALCYDLYTSWIGNSDILIRNRENTPQLVILVGLTLLVTSSPILLSAFWQRRRSRKTVESKQEPEHALA